MAWPELGGVDIALDLPVGLLRPPVKAMCILVPAEQRSRCADAGAIFVFTSELERVDSAAGARRAITLNTMTFRNAGYVEERSLQLRIDDETCAVQRLVSESMGGCDDESRVDDYKRGLALWSFAVDYTVKTLLYLSLDDTVISHDRAYSRAPRTFLDLGRRKRELRLAEVEQLYDRCIVGPARAH